MQKPKKTGLPEQISMRHDTHFVELLTSRSKGPLIRMVPLAKIDANPRQPRTELGDISELMASIKSKGVLEPILVRPRGDRYEIVAGERRYIASKTLGLSEIPSIEMNIDDREAMEVSLIENLQRKDLDAFEEADGLGALIDIYGYTHDQISDKIGKARSTITEIISLTKIPPAVRALCKEAMITGRTVLVEISKLRNAAEMERLVHEIKERGLKRSDTRDLTKELKGKGKKAQRAKPFIYRFAAKGKKGYRLRLEFRRADVSKEEIISVLEDILAELRGE